MTGNGVWFDVKHKMRRVRGLYGPAISLMLLAACAADPPYVESSTVATTGAPVRATSTTSVLDPSTTAAPSSEGLGDAISVTDRVTIVITDPDDG